MAHSICENIKEIKEEIANVQLVVVSKYRSLTELEEVYASGHRIFGENRVQELMEKYAAMPKDVNWHVIGHLQTNKVKLIVPFVSLIHSVDSIKLLSEINKQAKKIDRTVNVLLQAHIAIEKSKYGMKLLEIEKFLSGNELQDFTNVNCIGLMGMASNTDNQQQVADEFRGLYKFYAKYKEAHNWRTLSMGMSGDYTLAIANGSNMIRIGSKVFQ